MTLNYAHRGASGYFPENTMIAFEKAIELGCDAIETDVQMTSDGVLVLIHDEDVSRTTDGSGLVKDYTFNNLRKLSAGSWYDKKFSSEKIPTAEELILLTKSKGIKVNFELKTGIVLYPGIEEQIINLIYKYNMEHHVVLSSFNHYSMVHCKEIDKNITTGLLYVEGLYRPALYCKSISCDAIHPDYHTVTEEIVREAKQNRILVNAYTVDDENIMKTMLSWKIDGIITNYPDKLAKLKEACQRKKSCEPSP
ncbi:glycerophosphodiester phosphodiesterase [Clostridium thermarum]|uniref:glycerophosphodiester phosphodiesterase n=1 Tax=Clostridium thermarum TaxID=1716543 RepID=UPI00112093BC|nr:glycerophosphodiester phosphodiesterase [Clostridium thermarum]